MHWIILFLAGGMEITWAVAMKFSNGFTAVIPSAITVAGAIVSMILLGIALKQLPLGTAYAVWTGIGIAGTTVMDVLLFHEKISVPQLICIGLILAGIAGLRLLAKE